MHGPSRYRNWKQIVVVGAVILPGKSNDLAAIQVSAAVSRLVTTRW